MNDGFANKRAALKRQATHVDDDLRLCKVVNGMVFKYRESSYFSGLKYPCWSITLDKVESLTEI